MNKILNLPWVTEKVAFGLRRSFLRKQSLPRTGYGESSLLNVSWTPAFAGVTV